MSAVRSPWPLRPGQTHPDLQAHGCPQLVEAAQAERPTDSPRLSYPGSGYLLTFSPQSLNPFHITHLPCLLQRISRQERSGNFHLKTKQCKHTPTQTLKKRGKNKQSLGSFWKPFTRNFEKQECLNDAGSVFCKYVCIFCRTFNCNIKKTRKMM